MTRSLPAQFWHWCTEWILRRCLDKAIEHWRNLAWTRFEPGSSKWHTGALSTTPRARAQRDSRLSVENSANFSTLPRQKKFCIFFRLTQSDLQARFLSHSLIFCFFFFPPFSFSTSFFPIRCYNRGHLSDPKQGDFISVIITDWVVDSDRSSLILIIKWNLTVQLY
jgi:hypothetical protein